MAFVPTDSEILSKSDIRWIENGEAGEESVTNRPTDDVANFVNTVKKYSIFSDPTKKDLTSQTISYPLYLNTLLGVSGGETGGIRFFNNLGDSNDSASISLSKDNNGNQFLKISSLNDAGDQIQFEIADKDSIKTIINGTTFKVWHEANDGLGSGLDADLLQGQLPDTLNNPNTVVKRNSSGNFAANIITANQFVGNSTNVNGVVTATHGGTGYNIYTYGDMLFANTDSSMGKISIGNNKEYLVSTGKGSAPIWKRIEASDLLDDTIILPKNGGTGSVGITGIMYGNGQNAVTAATSSQIVNVIGTTKITNAVHADIADALNTSNPITAVSFNGITGLSSSTPLINGIASIGTSTTVARADHVHPIDTSKANLSGATFTGALGIIDGTVSAPSIKFAADSSTGIFRVGNGAIGFSTNGVKTFELNSSNTLISTPVILGSTLSANAITASTLSATSATLTGNLVVSSSNTTAGGIILSDDGDIVDMNDGWCSMRFSNGVMVRSGNRTGDGRIWLRSDGVVLATNNIIGYYSDERLKEKTGKIETPIEKVKSLNGFYYVENEVAKSFGFKNENQQIALSAQEVKEVVPEAVNLAPFDMEMDNEGNVTSKSGENYLTVDYAKLVPLLIEAIKEQQKQIEELQGIVRG